MIVVARPSWLVTLAGLSEGVIWIPAGSALIRCSVRNARSKKR
jgi:hypothetical protein